MNRDELRDLLLAQDQADSCFPFDEVTELFRIRGKMFALLSKLEDPRHPGVRVNLKVDPDLGPDLRASSPDIVPGWHMNKRHWVTVRTDASVSDDTVRWLVRHSWEQVVKGLPRKDRDGLFI